MVEDVLSHVVMEPREGIVSDHLAAKILDIGWNVVSWDFKMLVSRRWVVLGAEEGSIVVESVSRFGAVGVVDHACFGGELLVVGLVVAVVQRGHHGHKGVVRNYGDLGEHMLGGMVSGSHVGVWWVVWLIKSMMRSC
jgi:hypothetical protein